MLMMMMMMIVYDSDHFGDVVNDGDRVGDVRIFFSIIAAFL